MSSMEHFKDKKPSVMETHLAMKEQEGIPWIEIAAEKEREIQQLRKEKEELRNKVIEECIQSLSLSSAAPFMPSQEEILNSLKTK